MWKGGLTLPLTSKRLEEWNDVKSMLYGCMIVWLYDCMRDVIEVRERGEFSKEVRGAR